MPVPKSTTNQAAPTKTRKKQRRKAAEKKEVLYDKFELRLCDGDDVLTVEQAKQLLGWEESDDPKGAIFKMPGGKYVRQWNNRSNREFDMTLCKTLMSEILLGNWHLNGENIIIGKTGMIISGQHRLTALVLAADEWSKHPDRWLNWKSEPTLQTSAALGVSEDDETVNTVDTGKPRTFADVVYRSDLFQDLDSSTRSRCSKATEFAVKYLWMRTGAKLDAFSPRRTHSESYDFVQRHKSLLKCVRHVTEEDAGSERQIRKAISLGYAAGMMYLFACCKTDPKPYYSEDRRNRGEDQLDMSMMDKAEEFFVKLAQGDKSVNQLHKTIAELKDADDHVSISELYALFNRAWYHFSLDEAVTEKRLELEYNVDEDGVKHLAECPTAGGIDRGNPDENVVEPDVIDDDSPAPNDPTPEEIEERKKQVNEEARQKKQGKNAPKFSDGDKVHVEDQADSWDGTFRRIEKRGAIKLAVVEDEEGAEYKVGLSRLTLI